MNISVKKIRENAMLPDRKTSGAAGYDLCTCLDQAIDLPVGEVKLVPTGLAFAIPEGYHFEIRPRSGFSTKFAILVPNSPGTIDSDYRGELFVPLLNLGKEPFRLEAGMRIAQLLIRKTVVADWDIVEELPETERGAGGFGSTGI
ncbi:deoxyuridine 5'-triphosphate nucleotidohydrolase [Leptospira perolatii]|uniref:Deoxyuridine 5'-triphosphate nucleotidohydrolase n=1 Tax=Leptospira perolatii TaxID=2023191 RepID=A0A2M9ZL14_9LEPT|nr:dUTP diphosphatase [Leptospira perolatii]PJZ70369.1 deoxyuridine 5'-triphosphate nucleotidohydrolase [Leptospira perolatii]PJZ72747.1 deoxyuridine 5'-triphosphate nucleotidohydrolase [Leptospira perolatii]